MKEAENRFTIEGLVIKEMNVGESDRLVTLFTREEGLIRAFAAGAKNLRSKKAAATSLLTYGSFTILRKKESYRIYEAAPLRVFYGAGSDLEQLALAQYFCELAGVFAESDSSNSEFFRLILNSLHYLTEEKREPALMKAVTELRTAVLAGYTPDLVACRNCGVFEADPMYFDLQGGELVCHSCKPTGKTVPLSRTVLSAMRHIVYAEFAKLYAFEIPVEAARALSRVTGEYITLQTEYRFSTLAFYNSLQ
ncbi:MAG: DNA repair protein RecO [Clostridia bacterium]|nr:DNA repair protein RecO [Clostridia bacterium]